MLLLVDHTAQGDYMATIHGVAGQHTKREALDYAIYTLAGVCGLEAVVGGIIGYGFGSGRKIVTLAAMLVFAALFAVVMSFFKKLAASSEYWNKGSWGEGAVGNALRTLPDEYHVIHDLDTGFGNIDHIVIGPRGLFIIETKNWSGRVTAANGELLLNGEDTKKPEVRALLRTTVNLKEDLEPVLRPDVFVYAMIVFANPQAPIYLSKPVDCVNIPDIVTHIQKDRGRPELSRDEEHKIKDAILRIAETS